MPFTPVVEEAGVLLQRGGRHAEGAGSTCRRLGFRWVIRGRCPRAAHSRPGAIGSRGHSMMSITVKLTVRKAGKAVTRRAAAGTHVGALWAVRRPCVLFSFSRRRVSESCDACERTCWGSAAALAVRAGAGQRRLLLFLNLEEKRKICICIL